MQAISRHRCLGFASVERLVRPAAGRRKAPCENHPSRGGACTGCPLLELAEPWQREAKRRRLARLGLHVPALVTDGVELGYRWSSKRVVARREGRVVLGSYVEGSHRVASMSGCPVEHPLLAGVAERIEQQATLLGVEPANQAGTAGDLRAAWLRTDGRRVVVGLVVRGEPSLAASTLPSRLGSEVVGVSVAIHGGGGNSLRGGAARVLFGEPTLTLGEGSDLEEVGPFGFLQPNPLLATEARRRLLVSSEGEVVVGRLALDLYAGSGLVTRWLRARFDRVVPVEAHPESAARLGVDPVRVEDLLARVAEDPRHDLRAADLVVANPPRRGLGDAAPLLAALPFRRMAMLSCDPESLAADLGVLEAAGWRRDSLEAWDLLPQTPHVEVLVRLRR